MKKLLALLSISPMTKSQRGVSCDYWSQRAIPYRLIMEQGVVSVLFCPDIVGAVLNALANYFFPALNRCTMITKYDDDLALLEADFEETAALLDVLLWGGASSMIPTREAVQKWRLTLAARSDEFTRLIMECDEWLMSPSISDSN